MTDTARSQPIRVSEASRGQGKVSSAPDPKKISRKPILAHESHHRPPPSSSSSISALRSSSHDAVQAYRPDLSTTPHNHSVSSNGTPNPSSPSSSGSSSRQTPETPPAPNGFPHTFQTTPKPSKRSINAAAKAPLKAQRTSSSTKSASSLPSAGAKRMLDDDYFLPPVNVSVASISSNKANHILGPDGQVYTQGEAAKLGLIIRTACEACRNRKLKCSGTLPENGGCARCNSDDIQCVYSARAPIGRPKKRKVEEEQDAINSPVGTGKGKGKMKRSHSASNSQNCLATKIKTEEVIDTNLHAEGQPQVSSASSPSLQRMKDVDETTRHHNQTETPAQGEQPQQWSITPSHNLAAFVPSRPLRMYESPSHTPSEPGSNYSGPRLISTPTVWSQHQAAFAVTPSDAPNTPLSVISPAAASTSYANGQQSRVSEPQLSASASVAKLPSLDDLSVAAFLQSLDTLEISPAELLQQQQQMQQLSGSQFPNAPSGSGTPDVSSSSRLSAPFNGVGIGQSTTPDPLTASSVEEWATSSAILQPGLSFAVPADFSWWDLGINGADYAAGSATPSVSATPANELSSMVFPSSSPVQPVTTGSGSGSSGTHAMLSGIFRTQNADKTRRPTFSADQLWPRGADAGMGQGQIQHTVAATETGLGWSTLPDASHFADALSSPIEGSAHDASDKGSCCSSKPSNKVLRSPNTAQAENSNEQKPSCCSSKSLAKSSPDPPKPAPCCGGDSADATSEPVKNCCSGSNEGEPHAVPAAAESAEGSSLSKEPIEMGPLSTSGAVRGHAAPQLDGERKRHAATHAHHPHKVHCVPNPSGKGCTCLCDMSVALLSVKQVLRETDPHKADTKHSFATDTIQLTLTASQAIAAQCACSADCPTCQSDPSTEISASLLVSTALQIYARAVRILREGFAATSRTKAANGDSAESGAAAVQSFFGGLDVTIGTYKPSASNAKKIALYAIKLELKDLRRALGKISRMAQSFGAVSATVEKAGNLESEEDGKAEAGKQQGMNPIDQLVILKLYRQLTELLKTVEGLEDAA
ncbi:Zn(2)-C6 fungal-type domain-containing protein [Pseudozyma hubeiensis]|nr:Zn(2)-C6 fungal-type domain-containing protein [Pseudozyma hubeiensis]